MLNLIKMFCLLKLKKDLKLIQLTNLPIAEDSMLTDEKPNCSNEEQLKSLLSKIKESEKKLKGSKYLIYLPFLVSWY